MAYLILTSDLGSGNIVPLERTPLIVGRTDDCDVRVVSSLVSRRHARIEPKEDGWQVEDLASKNGIRVNGQPVTRIMLNDGDLIDIGSLQLKFCDGPLNASPIKLLDKDAVTRLIIGDHAGLESRRRLTLLLEIAQAIDSFDTPDRLLEKFGELVVHLFQPSYCLLKLDGEQWCHDSDSTGTAPSVTDNDVLERVERNGEAYLQERGGQPSRLSDGTDSGESIRIRSSSAMGAPVLVGANTVGVLYVERGQAGGDILTEEDLLLLIGVGRLLSAAFVGGDRFAHLAAENRLLRSSRASASPLVGQSGVMKELRKTVEQRVGPVRSTVLLMGATGTGKSAVAQAIHLASPRRNGPFVKINCAAIPQELLESELFGHERGAFSGATQRKIGQFEVAHHGTLLLDEVGELAPSAQAKLLAVIQDRQLVRVGGAKTVDLDVRLIAASNRDLEQDVQAGRFRADLFYRLNVVRLEIPPLCERPADIPELASHFLELAQHEVGKRVDGISNEAMAVLKRHDWPGNARELSNCIERAVIFADEGQQLQVQHLPSDIRRPAASSLQREDPPLDERELIISALEQSAGNKREAARILGWYPQKLYSRLKRYNITVAGTIRSKE